MEFYFDGCCPESLLKGKRVEMRLNKDDFWESEATGLQVTVFPPFATILTWRGKGNFRQSTDVASNSLVRLVMTQAQKEEGKEIFPDKENIIKDKFDLEWYFGEIYESKQEFEAAKFNPNDPIFQEQEQYLNNLTKKEFENLFAFYEQLRATGYDTDFLSSGTFQELHKTIYDLKLIFNFKWMAWHSGWKNINDASFNYSSSSLLDI